MIIGLTGQCGTGKDTIAQYLVSKGYKQVAFADKLKEIIAIITGWSRSQIDGLTEESRIFRETIKHPIYNLTCRELLIKVGNDMFRNMLHPDIWVNLIDLHHKRESGDLIVVSDIRYTNEVVRLRQSKDFILIQVGENPVLDEDIKSDIIVLNNGTKEELYAKIDAIIYGIGKL